MINAMKDILDYIIVGLDVQLVGDLEETSVIYSWLELRRLGQINRLASLQFTSSAVKIGEWEVELHTLGSSANLHLILFMAFIKHKMRTA